MSAPTIRKATLRTRLKHQFNLDTIVGMNALQALGLVSDECLAFEDIAESAAARILDNWPENKKKLGKDDWR